MVSTPSGHAAEEAAMPRGYRVAGYVIAAYAVACQWRNVQRYRALMRLANEVYALRLRCAGKQLTWTWVPS